MSVKRYVSQVIKKQSLRVIRFYVNPQQDEACEIPIPNQVIDKDADLFAKLMYLRYSPNRCIEFVPC